MRTWCTAAVLILVRIMECRMLLRWSSSSVSRRHRSYCPPHHYPVTVVATDTWMSKDVHACSVCSCCVVSKRVRSARRFLLQGVPHQRILVRGQGDATTISLSLCLCVSVSVCVSLSALSIPPHSLSALSLLSPPLSLLLCDLQVCSDLSDEVFGAAL